MKILVGTYTQGKSEGIYRLDFNPVTGSLSNEGLVVKTQEPSFLVVSKDQNRVYAVKETEADKEQKGGGVSSFQWKAGRDELALLNNQNSRGAHPCYLSLSENGRFLSVANYTGGNFAVFELDKEGKLKDNPQVRQHQGSGQHRRRPHDDQGEADDVGARGKPDDAGDRRDCEEEVVVALVEGKELGGLGFLRRRAEDLARRRRRPRHRLQPPDVDMQRGRERGEDESDDDEHAGSVGPLG